MNRKQCRQEQFDLGLFTLFAQGMSVQIIWVYSVSKCYADKYHMICDTKRNV